MKKTKARKSAKKLNKAKSLRRVKPLTVAAAGPSTSRTGHIDIL